MAAVWLYQGPAWGGRDGVTGLAGKDAQDTVTFDVSPGYWERARLKNLCRKNFIGQRIGKAVA